MRRCAEGLSVQTPHGLLPILRDVSWTYSLPPCDSTSTDMRHLVPLGPANTFATILRGAVPAASGRLACLLSGSDVLCWWLRTWGPRPSQTLIAQVIELSLIHIS